MCFHSLFADGRNSSFGILEGRARRCLLII